MKKTALLLFLAGLFASAGPASAVPAEKKVQLSLGLNVVMLSESYGNDSKGIYGQGLGGVFNWGGRLWSLPESPPGSAAGPPAALSTSGPKALLRRRLSGRISGGSWDDWGINSLFKVHAGAKGRNWLLALSYVTNRWLRGFGLAAGYIF